MPCISDYLNPTGREQESVRVLSFLSFLSDYGITGRQNHNLDRNISKAYGREETLDKDTSDLCAILKRKDGPSFWSELKRRDRIAALRLELWWEKHKAADRMREEHERRKEADQAVQDRETFLRLKNKYGW